MPPCDLYQWAPASSTLLCLIQSDPCLLPQPLLLSPNQIYWVCVASVSPGFHPPWAISPICPQQFHYVHCATVLLSKESALLHQNWCFRTKPLIQPNYSSWIEEVAFLNHMQPWIILLQMLWDITELFRFFGTSRVKADAWLFVDIVRLAWWSLSVRIYLCVQNNSQDELHGEATVGQCNKQLLLGIYSPWGKCPKPLVPTTLWGPGDPQEEIVYGRPTGLGPGPGKSKYGTQSQFEPSETAFTSYCLQMETDIDWKAEEETLQWRGIAG